jgi:3-oxoacyl-[acyl-carrier-protein] synthase II
MSARRFVITGMGVLTSLGLDVDSTWQGVSQGKSGIGPITAFDASALPSRIAGELPGFNARNYGDKTFKRNFPRMARTLQLAAACAYTAMDQGKVDRSRLDPTRFGVVFGSSLVAIELEDLAAGGVLAAVPERPGFVDMDIWGEHGIPTVQPTFMLKYLPNFLACHVSMLLDAQGPNNSITETDAASLLALGEAFRILQREGADFFLVGGAESKVNPLSLVRQSLFEQLSCRNDEPWKAHRAFDRDRDGFVVGEGGTVLVFETLEHARQRGAKIYAEVVGFGAAFDLRRDGAGLARAIHAALGEAGLGTEDIDHINAHGVATDAGDVMEANGLRQAFGDRLPPVVAYKAHVGNLGAGCSLTELAISLQALEHGVLPGTLNHDNPDPACPIRVHTGASRPIARPAFLKVACTNQGQCAAVVLRQWRE